MAPRQLGRRSRRARAQITRRRVGQGERARDVGRRHLTHAVTDHGFGLDSPRPPQGGLRDLDREDRGLHDADVAEPRIVVLGE